MRQSQILQTGNRMFLINPFKIGSGDPYAVNGKSPIAAWIPSLDDSGNGTTTLNDLAGSNNGTLTNMNAASDWVADTDAGGVRALDFDGTNDRVEVPSSSAINNLPSSDWSISVWFKFASLTVPASSHRIAAKRGSLITQGWIAGRTVSNTMFFTHVLSVGTSQTETAAITDTSWHHFAAVWDGTALSSDIYIDSVLDNASKTAGTGTSDDSSGNMQIGSSAALTANQFWFGRLDDMRLFDQSLNPTDIAALYASGNGRGV